MLKQSKNYKIVSIKNENREEFHDILGLSGCEISINTLPAGVSVPFTHTHKQNEEVYIVLEGHGMLFIDGDELKVRVGNVIFINPNGERCFKADNKSRLKFICIQTKANSLEQFSLDDGIIGEDKPSWLKQNYS